MKSRVISWACVMLARCIWLTGCCCCCSKLNSATHGQTYTLQDPIQHASSSSRTLQASWWSRPARWGTPTRGSRTTAIHTRNSSFYVYQNNAGMMVLTLSLYYRIPNTLQAGEQSSTGNINRGSALLWDEPTYSPHGKYVVLTNNSFLFLNIRCSVQTTCVLH